MILICILIPLVAAAAAAASLGFCRAACSWSTSVALVNLLVVNSLHNDVAFLLLVCANASIYLLYP